MKRAFRNFLWPRYVSSAPNLMERVGRVLHWLLVFLVAPITAAIVFGTMANDAFVAAALAFVCLAVAGRAVRYILSAE